MHTILFELNFFPFDRRTVSAWIINNSMTN